jgi:hypothetical protein
MISNNFLNNVQTVMVRANQGVVEINKKRSDLRNIKQQHNTTTERIWNIKLTLARCNNSRSGRLSVNFNTTDSLDTKQLERGSSRRWTIPTRG